MSDRPFQPMTTAPKDREIEVITDAREGLPPLVSKCRWHPNAGFCVDELYER